MKALLERIERLPDGAPELLDLTDELHNLSGDLFATVVHALPLRTPPEDEGTMNAGRAHEA